MNCLKFLFCSSLVLGCLGGCPSAPVTVSANPTSSIVKRSIPSVVSINALGETKKLITPFGDDPFFGLLFGSQSYTQRSSGSGVIISQDGYIATCAHVIDQAKTIRVTLSNGTTFKAESVFQDNGLDLSILKLNLTSSSIRLPYLDLAKGEIEVGDSVIAIGNAFGVGQTVTHGIISAGYRAFESRVMLQTDAPINPGNSGGPIITENGEIAGLASAIASKTGASHGVGFLIPAKAIEYAMRRVIQKDPKPWLPVKVQTADPSILEALNVRNCCVSGGCMVTEVQDSSLPLHPGDMIIAVDGSPTLNKELFKFFCKLVEIGKTYELGVIKANDLSGNADPQIQTVLLKSIKKEETTPSTDPNQKEKIEEIKGSIWRGGKFQNSTDGEKGVRVIKTPKGQSLIQKGDIIIEFGGGENPTIADLKKSKDGPFSITLKRGNSILQKRVY